MYIIFWSIWLLFFFYKLYLFVHNFLAIINWYIYICLSFSGKLLFISLMLFTTTFYVPALWVSKNKYCFCYVNSFLKALSGLFDVSIPQPSLINLSLPSATGAAWRLCFPFFHVLIIFFDHSMSVNWKYLGKRSINQYSLFLRY